MAQCFKHTVPTIAETGLRAGSAEAETLLECDVQLPVDDVAGAPVYLPIWAPSGKSVDRESSAQS